MAENKGFESLAANAVFLVLVWIAGALRCYARAGMLRNFGLDDWFAMVTVLLYTPFAALCIAGVHYGVGQHSENLSYYQIQTAMKLWYFNEMVYTACITCTKVSICLYLNRIASSKLHIWMINGILISAATLSTSFVVFLVFQCSPIPYFWTRFSGGSGTCISSVVIADIIYTYAGINIVWDVALAIIPVLIVKDLQMNTRVKISVGFLLALGSFGGIASIIRIPCIKAFNDSTDFLYTTTDVAVWSAIEMGLGIVASCLATTKPIFKRFLIWSGTKYFSNSKNRPTNDYSLRSPLDSRFNKRVSRRISRLNDNSKNATINDIEMGEHMEGVSKAEMEIIDEEMSDSWRSGSKGSTSDATVTIWSIIDTNNGGSSSDESRFSTSAPTNKGITKSTVVEISRS